MRSLKAPFIWIAAALLLLLQSCQAVRQTSKHGFNEGWYKSRIFHKKVKKIYVVPSEDSIKAYTKKRLQRITEDTTGALKIAFPATGKPADFEDYFFRQNSVDADLLSMLFRYRPARAQFPHQLLGGFNGVVYLGYRTDLYHLHYNQTPLRVFKREIRHYAFSTGVFTGIGSAPISGSTTNDAVSIYYDGFVNLSGIAALVLAERLSLGVSLGFDHLLDKNRKVWLYQGKPWIGLSVGVSF